MFPYFLGDIREILRCINPNASICITHASDDTIPFTLKPMARRNASSRRSDRDLSTNATQSNAAPTLQACGTVQCPVVKGCAGNRISGNRNSVRGRSDYAARHRYRRESPPVRHPSGRLKGSTCVNPNASASAVRKAGLKLRERSVSSPNSSGFGYR